ncbi:tyrosine-type recombinase/integrase [Sulfurimonas sp.]|uniref:tyrosine-type recombinase/integrase n=1 Tax=Sulfurimonas sp. TaxID=2022749 RepID=UPI003D128D61
MSLYDELKKINISPYDCKGLYFKDPHNIIKTKEVTKAALKNLDHKHITIVIRLYHRNKSHLKQIDFFGITGLQAVSKAILRRAEFKNQLQENGIVKKRKSKTLNEYWDEYVSYKTAIWGAETKKTNTTFYDKWIRKTAGGINFDKVTTRDLQDIVNDILKAVHPKTKKPYAPRTAASVKQQIRALYNYYKKQNVIEKNPAENIEIPKYDNTIDFQLNEHERKALFEAIKNYPIPKYRGVMLFIYAGRRLNEVLTLDWKNIHFDKKTYTISYIYSKNRRIQEFPLSSLLEDFLTSYSPKKSGFIFTADKDETKSLSQETFRRHWKKVIDDLKIDHMRIHDTRHLLGNTMINKGYSLEAVGKSLGHSSVYITKRYAKVDINTANEVLSDYLS